MGGSIKKKLPDVNKDEILEMVGLESGRSSAERLVPDLAVFGAGVLVGAGVTVGAFSWTPVLVGAGALELQALTTTTSVRARAAMRWSLRVMEYAPGQF